jgi:hypothetical protein
MTNEQYNFSAATELTNGSAAAPGAATGLPKFSF